MDEHEKIEEEAEIVNEVKNPEVVENISNENTSYTAPETEPKGMSIASLVLGISAFFITKTGILALACGILAIIFGVKGQKQGGKGMAKAGFILGIVYVSLYVVLIIGVVLFGISMGAALVGAGVA